MIKLTSIKPCQNTLPFTMKHCKTKQQSLSWIFFAILKILILVIALPIHKHVILTPCLSVSVRVGTQVPIYLIIYILKTIRHGFINNFKNFQNLLYFQNYLMRTNELYRNIFFTYLFMLFGLLLIWNFFFSLIIMQISCKTIKITSFL